MYESVAVELREALLKPHFERSDGGRQSWRYPRGRLDLQMHYYCFTHLRDMLQYAGQRWAEEGARALLVLGLRAEATESLPAPYGWTSELGRALPVRRLALNPLAFGETLDLVRTLARGTRGRNDVSSDLERFGRWLFEETGGHPLFLAEAIKTLLDRGVLTARPGSDGTWVVALTSEARDRDALGGLVPESVREARPL